MGESIIVALITGGVTLVICLVNNHYQRMDSEKKHAETMALITYRLDELTKQVEKHNSVIDRTYALERGQSVLQEKLTAVNKRIDELGH